jgi:hypothetical protein
VIHDDLADPCIAIRLDPYAHDEIAG